MNKIVLAVFSLSILIAGIIGILRFKVIRDDYKPFIYLVWFACINEILCVPLWLREQSNIIITNIYSLFEGLVILLFFTTRKIIRKRTFIIIGTVFFIGWLVETFVFKISDDPGIYYGIFYSLIIVLISIICINQLLLTTKSKLLKNAMFLICMAFIIYFTLCILINAFWLYGLTKNQKFLIAIYRILQYTNLFTNLIFALASLWIPRKQPSILLY